MQNITVYIPAHIMSCGGNACVDELATGVGALAMKNSPD
jgi:hypothetical protein